MKNLRRVKLRVCVRLVPSGWRACVCLFFSRVCFVVVMRGVTHRVIRSNKKKKHSFVKLFFDFEGMGKVDEISLIERFI